MMRGMEEAVGPMGPLQVRPGLRARKKEFTRQAITAAALELFIAQGYEATTVEQIADLALVSPATFFRYFGTKDEVIFPEAVAYCTRLCQALINRPARESDFRAARNAAREAFGQGTKHDHLRYRYLEESITTTPTVAGRLYAIRREWQDAIAEALAKRRQIDEPTLDVRLTAAIIMATISLGTRVWYENGSQESPSRFIDEAFERLLSKKVPQ